VSTKTIDTATATTAELADFIIWPVTGRDTRDCDRLPDGTYRLSTIETDLTDTVTAHDIVVGVYGWSVHILTYRPDVCTDGEVAVARAIITGDWTRAAALMWESDNLAGIEMWDVIGQVSAEVADR
jgi:hypothetical protein